MGRKNKRKPVETFTIPKDLIMEAQKPRYNAYQTGTGAHKSAKDYKRRDKHKKDFRYDY